MRGICYAEMHDKVIIIIFLIDGCISLAGKLIALYLKPTGQLRGINSKQENKNIFYLHRYTKYLLLVI
jgi:hypothetical protein